ncbi:MAG TPA: 30S ribosomal protein S6 [Candidatus Pacebacteria bacterium]|nr:30S ribosomal protein S6 [Candidatus Paceibacterota bacterium]
MEYELMFLIADKDRSEFDRIKGEVKKLVTTAGGEWTGESVEFERKLAYEIKHNWKGIYFVQRFTLPDADEREEDSDVVGNITRQMNLQKDILRYIIVNAAELPSLESFAKEATKDPREHKAELKEKGEKIDGKLEKALNL